MSVEIQQDQQAFALLTTEEAARDELRCHPQTLVNWRSNNNGEGPPFVRVGRRVFYRRGDIRRWLQAQTVGGAQ